MTKQYPLIKVQDGYVVVDKEVKPEIADWYWDMSDTESLIPIYQRSQSRNSVYANCYKIIAHTGINSLKDSGLPLVELSDVDLERIKTLAYQKFGYSKATIGNPYMSGANVLEGFIAGYKAAGGFSLTDLENAYNKGWEDKEDGEEYCDDIEAKFKKKPVAVVLETEPKDPYSYDSCNDFKSYVPKISNNHVIVKEVIYDKI